MHMNGVKYMIFYLPAVYQSQETKVNTCNLTPDNGQNLIYPQVVLKFDPKEPKLFYKSQNLLKISSKMHFLLPIILSSLDNIQKLCIVLILLYRIPYIANNLGFSSILIFGGGVIQLPLTCPRTYKWSQMYEFFILS